MNHNDRMNPLSGNLVQTETRQETTDIFRKNIYHINLCAGVGHNYHRAHRFLLKVPILLSKTTFLTSILSHSDVIIEL